MCKENIYRLCNINQHQQDIKLRCNMKIGVLYYTSDIKVVRRI